MSLTRLVSRARSRQAARENVQARGTPRRSRLAAVQGGSLVRVNGITAPGYHVPAQNGSLVRVENIGRPSNAQYASESQGNGVIVARGGAGGAGGGAGMLVHDLEGAWHTGTLGWNKLTTGGHGEIDGSSLAHIETRPHSVLSGRDDLLAHPQYALVTRRVLSGLGLSGGGDLSADRTFAVKIMNAGGLSLSTTDGLYLTRPQSITFDSQNISGAPTAGHTHHISSTTHTNIPSAGGGFSNLFMRSDDFGGFMFGKEQNTTQSVLGVHPGEHSVSVNVPRQSGMAMVVKSGRTDQGTAVFQRIQNQELDQDVLSIRDSNDRSLIRIKSSGDVESGLQGFVSGESGWQIRPNGDAEFNDVTVRGALRASIFVKDEVHATNGTFLVTTSTRLVTPLAIPIDPLGTEFMVHRKGALPLPSNIDEVSIDDIYHHTHLAVNSIVKSRSVSRAGITVNMYTEWPVSGQAILFKPNDVVRIKSIGEVGDVIVADVWLKIIKHDYVTQAIIDLEPEGHKPPMESSRYQCEVLRGTAGIIPKGAAVVRYGQGGDGHILMTADMKEAPYIDIRLIEEGATPEQIPPNNDYTPGQEQVPGDAVQTVSRLGRLTGLGVIGPQPNEVGLAISTDFGNSLAPRGVFSNKRFELVDIDITLNRIVSGNRRPTVQIKSDGSVSFGRDLGSGSAPALKFDSTTGNLMLGNFAGGGNGVNWDQATGNLLIKGSVTLTNKISETDVQGLSVHLTTIEGDITSNAGDITSNAGAIKTNTDAIGKPASGGNAATGLYKWVGDEVSRQAPDLSGYLLKNNFNWNGLGGRPAFVHPTPGSYGAGLHLDTDHMGFYNGSKWLTYMDKNGVFFLRGPGRTDGYLRWDPRAHILEAGKLLNDGNLVGGKMGTAAWATDSATGTIMAGGSRVTMGRYGINFLAEAAELTGVPTNDAQFAQRITWFAEPRAVDTFDIAAEEHNNAHLTGFIGSYRARNRIFGTEVNAVEIMATHSDGKPSVVELAALSTATTKSVWLTLSSYDGNMIATADRVHLTSRLATIIDGNLRVNSGSPTAPNAGDRIWGTSQGWLRWEANDYAEMQAGPGPFDAIYGAAANVFPWQGSAGRLRLLGTNSKGGRVHVNKHQTVVEFRDKTQWTYMEMHEQQKGTQQLRLGWTAMESGNRYDSRLTFDRQGVRLRGNQHVELRAPEIVLATPTPPGIINLAGFVRATGAVEAFAFTFNQPFNISSPPGETYGLYAGNDGNMWAKNGATWKPLAWGAGGGGGGGGGAGGSGSYRIATPSGDNLSNAPVLYTFVNSPEWGYIRYSGTTDRGELASGVVFFSRNGSVASTSEIASAYTRFNFGVVGNTIRAKFDAGAGSNRSCNISWSIVYL